MEEDLLYNEDANVRRVFRRRSQNVAESFGNLYPIPESESEMKPKKICILENVLPAVMEFVDTLKYAVVSEQSAIHMNETDSELLFVLEDFTGPVFDNISTSQRNRIIGVPALLELIKTNQTLKLRKRNTYNLSMGELIIYLSMKNKAVGYKIAKLIRYMGGSIRDECNRYVTHIVSDSTFNRSYEYAKAFSIHVMDPEWVEAAWSQRKSFIKADCELLMKYKLKPFSGLFIHFFEFPESYHLYLLSKLEENKGIYVSIDDERCTHIVCESGEESCGSIFSKIKRRNRIYIVNCKWFWDSIDDGFRARESSYLLAQEDTAVSSLALSEIHPASSGANESPSEIESLSVSRSSDIYPSAENVNCCWTSKKKQLPKIEPSISCLTNNHPLNEFIETETRYEEILEIILKINKEAVGENENDSLISQTEAKLIFSNIELLAAVHRTMLKEIINSKDKLLETVPEVIIRYKEVLLRQYPIFCSTFEESQETLDKCRQLKPQFKKLLDRWKNKNECERQHLKIRKTLPKEDVLQAKFKDAEQSLEEVMSVMNADKAKIDKLCAVFETYNSIINCPADIISSSRTLLVKFYAQELTNKFITRNYHLVCFVFSDVIQIGFVRKRVRAFWSTYCNKKNDLGSSVDIEREKQLKRMVDGKLYKHLTKIPFTELVGVIDITDTQDVKESFGLVMRTRDDVREIVCCFRLLEYEEHSKQEIIDHISKGLALFKSSPTAEQYVTTLLPGDIDPNLGLPARKNLCDAVKSCF